ncbi:MAG TPA: helix-turn-helix transcriptional regulator [Streptosporangiaceae bacterium]|jgi:hypothetical protein|nr:helix-turn-helix transcriptional regulator [Streptosporangiaceae bacterium]
MNESFSPEVDAAPGRAGATAARMVLGTALSRLRTEAGLSAGEASAVTGVPAPLITDMELGQASVRLWDVAGLYSAYGVSDLAARTTLLGLAHRANGSEWWHSYRDVIPAWFEHYLGLEQAASLIRCYAGQVIPALLQTPDYSRAAVAASHADATESDRKRRVELSLRRQQILLGESPVRLWAVLDEAALRRSPGSVSAMRGQLRRLIELSEMPHVTIAVLPFRAGAHPAISGGPLVVLRLPDRELPDVAYLEQLGGSKYFQDPAYLDFFRHILNQLALQAESAGPGERILRQILDEI